VEDPMVAHSALGLVELQNGLESEEVLHMTQQQTKSTQCSMWMIIQQTTVD
jgi:hypothetical protein